jgi:hypothetical protein
MYAFLVGIESYHQPGWSIDGPCRNALDVAAWLLKTKMPPGNITMFLAPNNDALDNEIKLLINKGVKVEIDGTYNTLDTYYRTNLQEGRESDSTLLVYWSGHGATNKSSDRVFFCADYTSDKLTNRVINCTELLNVLRKEEYGCFSRQVLMADVCAVYSTVRVPESPADYQPQKANQVAYFATPEANYAKGTHGRGEFTKSILRVLQGLETWHSDLDALDSKLTSALLEFKGRMFRVDSRSPWGRLVDRVVGADDPIEGNPRYRSVMELLNRVHISTANVEAQYRATVINLLDPTLNAAQGVSGMVEMLSTLREPDGLLQLIVRLAQRDVVDESDENKENREQAINTWLNEDVYEWLSRTKYLNLIEELRNLVEIDARRRILCIEIDHDDQTEIIAGYRPYLLRNDYVMINEESYQHVSVSGWEPFVASLQELFKRFMVGDTLNVEVQFAVDPPLFDHPYHRIPVKPGGSELGAEAVVLVRWRTRLRFAPEVAARNRWEACADEVRSVKPNKLQWARFGREGELPKRLVPCFAEFALPAAWDGRRSLIEKDRVRRVLLRGAPYVYVAQSPPKDVDWAGVEEELQDWLDTVDSLDLIPDHVLKRRIDECRHVSNGMIVWDDPRHNPFPPMGGPVRA